MNRVLCPWLHGGKNCESYLIILFIYFEFMITPWLDRKYLAFDDVIEGFYKIVINDWFQINYLQLETQ